VTGINIIAATHKAQTSWRSEAMWHLSGISEIQLSQGAGFALPEIQVSQHEGIL